MNRVYRIAGSLLFAAALGGPAVVMASGAAKAGPQEDRGVYDREHKDYHHWDDKEDGAWRRFQGEKHWKEHEFAKASRKQQEEYWKWRHNHPD
jgi:hypothetical protein